MISKTLENIEKDIKFLKEISNDKYFKKIEQQCEFVNNRNKELQERIDKTITKIENLYDTNSTKQEIIYVNNLILNDILNTLKGDNK